MGGDGHDWRGVGNTAEAQELLDYLESTSPRKRGKQERAKIPLFIRNGPTKQFRSGEIEREWGRQVQQQRRSFTAPVKFGKDEVKHFAPKIKESEGDLKVFDDSRVPPMLHKLAGRTRVWGPPMKLQSSAEEMPRDMIGINVASLMRQTDTAVRLNEAENSPRRPRMDGPPSMRSGAMPSSKEAVWLDSLCSFRGFDATALVMTPPKFGGRDFTPKETPRMRLEKFAGRVEAIMELGAPVRLSLKSLERQDDKDSNVHYGGSVSARGVKGEAKALKVREGGWKPTDPKPPRLDISLTRFEAERGHVADLQKQRWIGMSTWTSREHQVSDRAKDPFSGMVFTDRG